MNENKVELSDSYLRLYAEFENYKKRVQKEKEEIRSSTKSSTLSAILDIDNDLHIASKQVKSDGISLILSKLDTFLKSQGIESIQTNNYDPDLHEVVSIISTGEKDKIVDVVSKGYRCDNSIIRYPKVIIST